MKRLSRQLQRLYVDALIWSHYGQRHPERIPLSHSRQHLYVNPRDWRARKKLIVAGIRGRYPRNQKFFHHAVETFAPDTILDVGLNYGECLLSLEYPVGTRLFGFDANAALQACVEKSLREHPNRDQIRILYQLVSDVDDGFEEFFIDEQWSGGSAAGLRPEFYDPQRHRKVRLPKSSIDSTLSQYPGRAEKLFFKIDVEGFEPKVLAGMRQTLESTSQAVGFIEFNGVLLDRSGTDVSAYWEHLSTLFDVLAFDPSDRLHYLTGAPLSRLREVCGKYFRTDLILLRGISPECKEQLIRPWPSDGENSSRAA